MSEVPVRFGITISFYENAYWAVIQCPVDNSFTRVSHANLTKFMNMVGRSVREKEKALLANPPVEEEKPRILTIEPSVGLNGG